VVVVRVGEGGLGLTLGGGHTQILGIGDQGVGGIGISIAKLVLMTLCGGVCIVGWDSRTRCG